jgi:integrase
VDIRSGVVTLTVSKTRPRIVPLTDRAVLAVTRWLRQRGVGHGSLWNSTDPYTVITNAMKRCSDGKITAHQLRRRFTVNWLLRGGSEIGLMRRWLVLTRHDRRLLRSQGRPDQRGRSAA